MAWRRNTFVSARHRAPLPRRDVRVKEFLYDPVAIQLFAKILDAEHRPNMPSSRTSKRRTDEEQASSRGLLGRFRASCARAKQPPGPLVVRGSLRSHLTMRVLGVNSRREPLAVDGRQAAQGE
jgi:hypothetical protein